jgi:hypothetical protein
MALSLEAPLARNILRLAEDPRPSEPRPLYHRYEQFAIETDQPAGISDPGNATGIDAADLLRVSLGLANG